MSQFDPSDAELEERAKTMAEYYMGHRSQMGDAGISACLRRVAQENSKLYAHLQRELAEYIASSRGKKPK